MITPPKNLGGIFLEIFYQTVGLLVVSPDPVNALVFFEPRHLAFSIVHNSAFKLYEQLFFCERAPQIARTKAILKTKLLKSLMAHPALQEPLHLTKHARSHAGEEAPVNTLRQPLFRKSNADKKWIIWCFEFKWRNVSQCTGDLYRADEAIGIFFVHTRRETRVQLFELREQFTDTFFLETFSQSIIGGNRGEPEFVYQCSNIEPCTTTNDRELVSAEYALERAFPVAHIVRNSIRPTGRYDTQEVVGDTSHFFSGDFSCSDVHPAIHLS